MQHWGTAACPLCIAQRVCFLAVALLAGLGVFTHRKSAAAFAVLAGISQVAIFASGALAAKQTQLVLHPSNVCAVDYLAAAINRSWPARWVPWLLRADGVCSQAPHVLGVSLPVWSLVVFILLEGLLILAWRASLSARALKMN
jgi:disulfide bond formation protein DsbB